MRTSLALRQGVLWIARSASSTRVTSFDLNGRCLGRGFSIQGADGVRTDVRAIAVDEDRRIWVADAGSGLVRGFTAFGVECSPLRGRSGPDADHPEAYGDPAGIAAQGLEAEARILLARSGVRRHALLSIDPARSTTRSLRPDGDPEGSFESLAGVALSGRLAFACEAGRKLVQVFRDGEFHFRIRMPEAGRGSPLWEPRAVAALDDGRCVVACRQGEAGSVLLFDAGGRYLRRLDEQEDLENPSGIVCNEGGSERSSLILVLDRDGERIQAVTLDGRTLGSFHEMDSGEDRAAGRSRLTRRGFPGGAR